MNDWHAKSVKEVLSALETDRERGLSAPEAARRLERYGPNRLEGAKKSEAKRS